MAVDKNGKKLPSGIRQRANGSYEVRVSRNGKSYSAFVQQDMKIFRISQAIHLDILLRQGRLRQGCHHKS